MLELSLPHDLAAVGQARSWVTGCLSEWSEDGVSRAVLVTSELVANGIIHARTPLMLRLDVEDDCARLEVADGDPHPPATKRYGDEAATGRGLRLVGRLSEEWGARSSAGGKTVWAVIRDLPWAATGPEGVPELDFDAPAPRSGPPGEVVRLLEVPVAVLVTAQQHNDALRRELVFVSGSSHLSARLDALAEAVEAHFATAGDVGGTIASAATSNQAAVDLEVELSAEGWTSMLELSALLDEADVYCQRMELLTLESPPAVKAFRRWYQGEVRAQRAGRPPTPWPG